MARIKYLLMLLAMIVASTLPSPAAPLPKTANECMAPQTFLARLVIAGDWIVKRAPNHVADTEVTGVVFREGGMINVAVFQDGCLALIVIVGEASEDIKV
jgi:hypothetical protein